MSITENDQLSYFVLSYRVDGYRVDISGLCFFVIRNMGTCCIGVVKLYMHLNK